MIDNHAVDQIRFREYRGEVTKKVAAKTGIDGRACAACTREVQQFSRIKDGKESPGNQLVAKRIGHGVGIRLRFGHRSSLKDNRVFLPVARQD